MALEKYLLELFRRDSSKFIFVPVETGRVVGDNSSRVQLEEEKHYFRLWLSEMYLAQDRDWFKELYPVVHSLICFDFGNKRVEIPLIMGNLNFANVNVNNLSNVIRLNYAMTHLMPYNGGTIEINMGLMAMPGSDTLEKFIKVMGNFSGLLNVPELSTAIKLAPSLVEGVEELFGMSKNGVLELGLQDTFTGVGGGGSNILKSGYIAILKAQQGNALDPENGKLDVKKLWVVDDRLCYGSDATTCEMLKGFTYMLLRFEVREKRDDYEGLEKFYSLFDRALDEYRDGHVDEAEKLLRASQREAQKSQDLTVADQIRMAGTLRTLYNERKAVFDYGRTENIGVPVMARHQDAEKKTTYGFAPGRKGNEAMPPFPGRPPVPMKPRKLESIIGERMSVDDALARRKPP